MGEVLLEVACLCFIREGLSKQLSFSQSVVELGQVQLAFTLPHTPTPRTAAD